jgi:hypothetical protein
MDFASSSRQFKIKLDSWPTYKKWLLELLISRREQLAVDVRATQSAFISSNQVRKVIEISPSSSEQWLVVQPTGIGFP